MNVQHENNISIYLIIRFCTKNIFSGEVHQSAYVETTLKLELFDMVDIKKTGNAAEFAPKNFF